MSCTNAPQQCECEYDQRRSSLEKETANGCTKNTHNINHESFEQGLLTFPHESQEAAFFDSAAGTQESVVTSFTSSFALIGTGTGGLDVQEESWPAAQEGEPYAGYDDGFEEPRPSGSLGTT